MAPRRRRDVHPRLRTRLKHEAGAVCYNESISRPDPNRRFLFREVNERIRLVTSGYTVALESCDVFCECGRRECVDRFFVPMDVYDLARVDGRIFLMAPGHEHEDLVLDSTVAYNVVFAA